MNRESMSKIFIDSDTAKGMLRECFYKGQRKVRSLQLSYFERALKENFFSDGTQVIIAIVGEKKYLLDGQHRLNAIVNTGVGSEFWIRTIRMESMDEVARLYSTIDTNSRRSGMDGVRAYGVSEELNISVNNSIIAAVKAITRGFSNPVLEEKAITLDNSEISQLIREWSLEIQNLNAILKNSPPPVKLAMRKSSVYASAYITLRYAPDLAKEFWGDIAADNGLKQGDPKKVLLHGMMGSHHFTSKRGWSGIKIQAIFISKCWNYFVAGTSITKVAISSASSPVIFDFTPFDTSKDGLGIFISNSIFPI